MSIFSTISRAAEALRARRRLYHTERMIGALPPELLKDIGWPDPRSGHRGAAEGPVRMRDR